MASGNALKGFRRPMEEQEVIGYEPRIIEMAILVDECPNYLRVKKSTRFMVGWETYLTLESFRSGLFCPVWTSPSVMAG
jgi:hypothetical protein